jgi:hypothetical protein
MFLCMLLMTSNVFACEFNLKKLNVCVNWKFDESPVAGKNLKAQFYFTNIQNPSLKIVPEGNLKIDLWMPDMNHGSRPMIITQNESMTFVAEKIYFMMKGTWLVRMKLLGPADEVIDSDEMEIKI